MKARRHILAWLGLVLPTLAIGVLALGLLAREQARLDALARESARAQAQTVADNLDLIMAEIKSGVMQALAAASGPGDEEARLRQLVAENPFLEGYLIYTPRIPQKVGTTTRGGTIVGDTQSWASKLFDINQPFWTDPASADAMKVSQAQAYSAPENSVFEEPDYSSNYANTKMNRQAIREIAASNVQSINTLKQQEAVLEAGQVAQVDQDYGSPTQSRDLFAIFGDATEAKSGWLRRELPQGRLETSGWMAWYQRSPGGRVTSVVLDTVAVLSQLEGAFPVAEEERGLNYRLQEPAGRTAYTSSLSIYRVGDALAIPVGAELPGWELRVEGIRYAQGRGFLLLGGLLVAVLCAATLGAGTLLLLQARRDALEAARKTTFVSNVSHELRTPLTTIRMYSEMLEEGRVSDEDKRRRYLGTITAESQRLTRLVDNVLDFSRLEQGRKKYHREPVELVAVVDSVLEAQGPRLKEAGMAVDWQAPEAPMVVETDRDALGQVLLNLIDNAIKYAASGKSLRLAIERQATSLRLLVVDAGPGIPGKDAQRVFTAFQRLDESLTATQPGSGLGLSICRSLMRDLGGDVLLEPSASGCRFVISLPTDFKQEDRKERKGV